MEGRLPATRQVLGRPPAAPEQPTPAAARVLPPPGLRVITSTPASPHGFQALCARLPGASWAPAPLPPLPLCSSRPQRTRWMRQDSTCLPPGLPRLLLWVAGTRRSPWGQKTPRRPW
ncbi:hypothetical protein NDU88_007690 [Pleurodeles waltl]|uniref:Uncharacterized protein n=1 Tax=Pleurodeles waltl TaxID=8319 RepID=A0AAV7ST77_PLEWA|nr:hypothetical protein NDU88_007690 [Pleurodeles waltl]